MALTVKRPEKRVEVCLDGGIVARHEELSAKLETARRQRIMDKRMNDPVQKLAQEIRDLEEAAQADTVVFVIRALPRKDWQAFEEAHPAREDNEADKTFGVNVETLFDAVLSNEDPATIARVERKETGEAVEFAPADWVDFAADLTDGQYTEFQLAVLKVNRRGSEVPFSLTAYKETQPSDES